MTRFVLISSLALMVNACSYAISRPVAAKADSSISLEKLLSAPDAYKGKVVILGGTIAGVVQVRQGILLEVIQRELDFWGRPRSTQKTAGRFLVLIRSVSGAVAPGREITVAGEVVEPDKDLNGSEPYPLLRALELKVWPKERASERPTWWDPLYDPASSGKPAW